MMLKMIMEHGLIYPLTVQRNVTKIFHPVDDFVSFIVEGIKVSAKISCYYFSGWTSSLEKNGAKITYRCLLSGYSASIVIQYKKVPVNPPTMGSINSDHVKYLLP